MNEIRVRFAPSPTGNLHVGSARTAIFNWLFARHHGGRFILRIEDTDQERSRPEYTQSILEGMRWLGMDWDEGPEVGGDAGPYFQTERTHLYREAIDHLLTSGKAYPCFCSVERLETMREEQSQAGQQTRYDGRCRSLDPEEARRRMDSGEPWMLRLKLDVTPGELVEWDDLCKGPISINSDLLDDLVLVKSDGFPTYNFAVVVDDSGMRISHVIRGEDHISNTPKQILIYRALGLETPRFGHIPMILGPDRSKLSKRHGATNVIEYESQGFLSEAFFNFMALLGWSPADGMEIMNRQELVERFTLDRVVSHGAIFDSEKLKWMNLQYIKKLEGPALLDRCEPFLSAIPGYPGPYDRQGLEALVSLFRERMNLVSDLTGMAEYFFHDPSSYDEKSLKTALKTPEVGAVLLELSQCLAGEGPLTHDEAEAAVRKLAETRGFGAGKVIHPTRMAVSGRSDGPGLFELMAVLGRDTCIRRLKSCAEMQPWLALS